MSFARAALTLVLVAGLLAAAAPATAQNKIVLEGGALFPTGNLGDATSTSPYLGATFEFQRMNPLGQVALLSLFLKAGYAPLSLDDDVEKALESSGEDTDASYFEAAVGAKASSSASPLYVVAHAGYANFNPPGDIGSKSGMAMGIGLGMGFGAPAFHVAVEGRANFALLSDIDNIEFFTLTAKLGFPF
jgi:hypothetical protein